MGELKEMMEKESGFDHEKDNLNAACGVSGERITRIAFEAATANKKRTPSKVIESIYNSGGSELEKMMACFYMGKDMGNGTRWL